MNAIEEDCQDWQDCPQCLTHVRMYDMRQILSIRPIHVTVVMLWLFWTD